MGGAMDIVQSAVGLIGSTPSKPKSETSGQYASLKAEREAQEEQQRKQDAEERKHSREKVTDARAIERKRAAAKQGGKTTLTSGGIGIIEEPDVAVPRLKEKFGE